MTTSDAVATENASSAPSSGGTLTKIKPQPDYPPNPTLYVSNIDWSIKKPLLKRALLALFSRHGKVLEVIVLRGDSLKSGTGPKCLRGQAWVIFENVNAATVALQAERGFQFFGRPLMVNYAKEISDRIAKREGTYGAKIAKERREAKRKMEEVVSAGGDASKLAKVGSAGVTSVNDPSSLLAKPNAVPSAGSGAAGVGDDAGSSPGIQPSETPSPLLLQQNLPPDCNEMMLAMLFRQYSGYKEVKLVPSAGGTLAVIEFETESQATTALKALNGFKLNMSSNLDLTYGKR
mmetsp:Transcript_8985/g.19108  ORF Transcript_8985/g.19108 Transcript_8985/m.19108 type:complete len:291 (-) Transcript_8985:193-1065(-)|eukprot:CAMPEP_0171328590 /NCGR_PEP_ID=MMETSP0878-20121228/744_1 /TAXON_ID=67004 /ORGANISM="Thalassiosira weissflogii, Strain CCMP1336" /LENGTH=290 /DNA_ID=CAMNT_0011828449 /DNA_START=18 /DNA_END=890 /DNA_ORIENTATION=+